ncbi:MAG TPA: DegV family protein [Actinomycetota bacterium]|nr:DegV family protein [Actinomycetota bacterium]
MSRVAVVTDSAADLPPDAAASAGVTVVPLTVTFGDEAFLDGVELPPEAFWERVRGGGELPTTASPSPEAVRGAYERARADGAAAVASIHVSGKLSRTVDTARLAAAEASLPVDVVDTRSVSAGQGLVVLAAAGAATAGAGLDRVVAAATSATSRLAVAAALETVDFLRRGGRVGAARAALSELLRIRPVLSLDDGEPVLAARARTRRRAIDEALARAAGPAEAAAVFHAGAREAEDVADRLARATGVRPSIGVIGAVTGTHLGPGALGVAVIRAQ